MQEKEGEQCWCSNTFMRDFSAMSRDSSYMATEEKIEYLGTDGGRWVTWWKFIFSECSIFSVK